MGFWSPDKLVLGSDYPYGWVGELKRCVESVENLGIEAEELDKILNGNAKQLFKLN